MIKLRVVGYSDDLKNLILSSKKQGRRGSHVAPIDDHLFDVLEEVWRERRSAERDEKRSSRAAAVPAQSKLAPREVQRLLRAGNSPLEVAEVAGVDVAWVERFYTPVLHEKTGVINDVQNLWFEKPKLGRSGAPLGDSVLANLRSRHVRLSDDQLAESWDATRVESQPWVVTLEFPFRGRRQRAVWRYDPQRRTVVAGNRLAADLGWVKSGKKAASRAAAPPAKTRAPARKRPATKKRPAAKKRAPANKRAPAKRRPAAKKRPAPKRRPAAKKRPAVKRRAAAKKRRPARRTARRR